MDLEERLERIERLLAEVLRRLERLEALTGLRAEEARVGVELAAALALPLGEAATAIARAVAALRRLPEVHAGDAISRAIVEALAVKGPMSLRELEREVRRLRGKASRAAIRSRLSELERIGVVRIERRSRRMVISLASEDTSDTSLTGSQHPVDTGEAGSTIRERESEIGAKEGVVEGEVQDEGEAPAQRPG